MNDVHDAGFFNTQHDPSSSGGDGIPNESDDKKRNLVSVSLSQVIKLTKNSNDLIIHRQKVHTLTTVGVVLSVEELTSKTIYMIDDQSKGSPIAVQFWKNDDDNDNSEHHYPAQLSSGIMEKTYVRVYGHARYDEKKPYIVAFRIHPILDPNEVVMHILEVIHDSILLERCKTDALMNALSIDNDTTMKDMTKDNDESMDEMSGPRTTMGGFTHIQRGVMNFLNKESGKTPLGVHVNDIYTALSHLALKPKIKETLDFLTQEGHIFTTCDDDTYKSTDAN